MAEPTNIPHFVIEGDPTEPGSTAERVRYIEGSIRDNPEAFQHALERLGEAATAGTLDLSAIDTELTTLEQGASGLITKFFSQRYDMDIEYDKDTEDALAADPSHAGLLQKHHDVRSINSGAGVMKRELLPNPAAEPLRDAVRRSRLAFYLARTLALQPKEEAEQAQEAS
jgi:hypothetical protein